MNTKSMQAFGYNLLIAEDKPLDMIGSILIRPASAERHEKVLRGQVLSIGEGASEHIPEVTPGCFVYYDKFGMHELSKDDDGRKVVVGVYANIYLVED